jgi:hypothetical protein
MREERKICKSRGRKRGNQRHNLQVQLRGKWTPKVWTFTTIAFRLGLTFDFRQSYSGTNEAVVKAATETQMKFKRQPFVFLIAIAILAIGATIFTVGAGAQEDGWQILRADYGFRSQRTDVTDLLRDLLSRGGVNGRLAVSNQTMGGDPAIGKDKSLRIFARNREGQEREFDYNEGGFVDARMFVSFRRDDLDDRPTDRPGDRPGNYGGRDQDDRNSLLILRGFYGVQGRTVNVTDLLRGRVRDGVLAIHVDNGALGGDPAIGADKVLIVVYKYQGRESAAAVPEGGTLALP